MIALYTDLVELQLRALTLEDSQAWGCPLVPTFLRARVQTEVAKRQAA
jgi:hypothetical protein